MAFSQHYMWCLRKDPITGEKIKIFGELLLPAGAETAAFVHITFPTVVLAHDTHTTHTALAPLAEVLADHGVVTYAIDFCGTEGGKSDAGDFSCAMESRVADLMSAVTLMQEEPFCDTENLSLVTYGDAAAVGAAYVAQHGDVLKSMACVAPAPYVQDGQEHMLYAEPDQGGVEVHTFEDAGGDLEDVAPEVLTFIKDQILRRKRAEA
ncbi:MAG: hypothetical protein ACOX4F_09420 [Atopobiaceae bacterium]